MCDKRTCYTKYTHIYKYAFNSYINITSLDTSTTSLIICNVNLLFICILVLYSGQIA